MQEHLSSNLKDLDFTLIPGRIKKYVTAIETTLLRDREKQFPRMTAFRRKVSITEAVAKFEGEFDVDMERLRTFLREFIVRFRKNIVNK